MSIIDKTLVNLDTISKIARGKRVNTMREYLTIEDDSALQGLCRWRSGESRERDIGYVCQIIRTAITLCELLCESRYLQLEALGDDSASGADSPAFSLHESRVGLLRQFHSALLGSQIGLDNLCDTYHTDANVVAPLRVSHADANQCVMAIKKALHSARQSIVPV